MADRPEKSEKKYPHSGHRVRMKKKLLDYGGYIFDDLEIVESLLFYALPRVDTRPVAKELLTKFGSIKGILDADSAALREVKGIKDGAEALFILLRQVSLRDFGAPGAGNFRDPAVARDLLLRVYRGMKTESVFALYIGANGGMIDSEFVFRGGINSARFPLRAITEGVIRNRASGVIIAHNHPSGSVFPSSDDLITTDRIAAHLAANDIELVEHYIVGRNECAGILKRSLYSQNGKEE